MSTSFNEQAAASIALIDKRSASIAPVQPAMNPMQELQMRLVREGDISKLEKLMDLEERWRKAEALRAFNEAMAKFKAIPLSIRKNKHVHFDFKDGGGKVDYWHATLASICEQACPLLASCGLRHSWSVSEGQGGLITVSCILTHELGHSESVTLSGMPDASGKKNAIQQKGSTVSYLERYTFLAVTGLATIDQDDDGRGSQPQPEVPKLDEKVAADYLASIEGSGDEDELFSNYRSALDAAGVKRDQHGSAIPGSAKYDEDAKAFTAAKNTRLAQLKKRGAK